MTRRRITLAYTAVGRDDLPTIEALAILPGDNDENAIRRMASMLVAVDLYEPERGPHTAARVAIEDPGFVLNIGFVALRPEGEGGVLGHFDALCEPTTDYAEALADLLDLMDRIDTWRPVRVHLSWTAAMEHVSFEALEAVWNAVCPKTTTSYLDIDGVRATPIGPDWQPEWPMHVRDYEPMARRAAETPAGFAPAMGTMFDMLNARTRAKE